MVSSLSKYLLPNRESFSYIRSLRHDCDSFALISVGEGTEEASEAFKRAQALDVGQALWAVCELVSCALF